MELKDVKIHPSARIDCREFFAGPGTIINANAHIFGTRVRLGRECWIGENAIIGGGGAYNPRAFLSAKNWLHMGVASEINIDSGVIIGNEVGLGSGTKIFTHGAYLSRYHGFPVTFSGVEISDDVWIPNAQINPGTNISSKVVVASGSVVSGTVTGGSFIGGSPAKYIGKSQKIMSQEDRYKVIFDLLEEIKNIYGIATYTSDGQSIVIDETVFRLDFHDNQRNSIEGPVTDRTKQVKNYLRRNGIRFEYEDSEGHYKKWPPDYSAGTMGEPFFQNADRFLS